MSERHKKEIDFGSYDKYPRALRRYSKLSPGAKDLWLEVGCFNNDPDAPCRASMTKLAARLGKSKQQIANLLSELKREKFIKRNNDGDLVRMIPKKAIKELEDYIEKGRVKETLKKPRKAKSDRSNKSDPIGQIKVTPKNGHRSNKSDPIGQIKVIRPVKLKLYDRSNKSDRTQYIVKEDRYIDVRSFIIDSSRIEICEPQIEKKSASLPAKKEKKKKRVSVSDIVFTSSDWQFQFASAFYKQLEARGKLSSIHSKNKEKTLQTWSHAFRILHGRKIEIELIRAVCTWLFSDSNKASFWIDGGNLATPEKLLKRTKAGDKYIIELLFNQMQYEATKAEQRKPELTRDEFLAEILA